MEKESKILVVGHNDVIENSLLSHLQGNGYPHVFSSSALFLSTQHQKKVQEFFKEHKPEYVFLSSVRLGGIAANQNYAAEFIYSNLISGANIIHAAYENGVKKLMYFGSSCVYPKNTVQPIKEASLLTGELEKTSEPYSIAKIAGIKMCEAYRKQYGFNAIVVISATVYGPEGDINIETAHVMGTLIAKFYDAAENGKKKVVVWGTGKPRREFLFIDDFVSASLFLMEQYEGHEIVNIGCGKDISIKELAELIARITGFRGEIIFDETKPDGAMKKLLDNSRIKDMGWTSKVDLEEGIEKIYKWYKQGSLP